ncbi:probable LRR receptor-like serine/threonine-protein kinase At3g47570 [Tripterygium wilfordii]|uniref:probable LRR receptor-like serine/threonine-protein kinase At3g47570 n=1 Tax=Tripterygium wilfordii TaxID=458696 RepID=UPI0018F842DB|nr:probable LRR receptor-like serine/threonine-protein kinase At3g47570 [Tripterygium wilfordii]
MEKIPPELSLLSKLQLLNLYGNKFVGTIPPPLGNLSSLLVFDISYNNLVGTVPGSLASLKNLQLLYLDFNNLTGIVPSSIFNISSLEVVTMNYNEFERTLPSDLGISLPKLKYIGIINNNFVGSIPPSISNATFLELIQVQKNRLSGAVPSLSKLQRLRIISVSQNLLGSGAANDLSFLVSLINATNMLVEIESEENNFGGVLLEGIGNLSTSLQSLSLGFNRIGGTIPSGIQNLVNLEVLTLPGNRISGNIPPNIGMLQKLSKLYLQENEFSGSIPTSLGNLTLLTKLRLGSNQLQGAIPPTLGNCQNLLEELNMSNNHLSGNISPQIFSISSLFLLDLSNNDFEGPLPIEVGGLINVGLLDVSKNKLNGDVPISLGQCMILEVLNMDWNFFQGHIPSSLSSLRGLGTIDLSHNNFSGEIPAFFATFLSLKALNLSHNDFEGALPTGGVFKNASAISVSGNSKLCGGIPEFRLPMCSFNNSKKRRQTKKLVISMVSALFGLALMLFLLVIFCLRKGGKKSSSNSSTKLTLTLSYQSIFRATEGFSSANLIGIGSFGSVYRGIFYEGRTIVAVKVLNLLRHGASKSFVAECKALRNIRHRDLVKVITACSTIDYQLKEFKSLVYELMTNGNLEGWLHPVTISGNAPRNLNLLQRVNIAIDVACALEYLHHHCETPIDHCDLKPSNVLLDDEMTAHVGDFGLAKFLTQANPNLSTQFSSIGIRGTIGYACPEYGLGSKVSTDGDVFSFGIILLEMFTGKRPTDKIFDGQQNIRNFVKDALPANVAEITDPILQNQESKNTENQSYTRNEDNRTLEFLISIYEIGIACSAESARERISISDAVTQLSSIRDEIANARTRRRRLT